MNPSTFIFRISIKSTTSSSKSNPKALQLIQLCAQRLRPNKPTDYGLILNAIGDAQIVMIGEASHGISERSEKSLSS